MATPSASQYSSTLQTVRQLISVTHTLPPHLARMSVSPFHVPEILDIIIDHLSNDNRALAASSLVCKAWLPSTRYHLFFAVTIVDTSNLTRFLHDLDSPLCTIAPFIRHLTLHGCDYLSSLPTDDWFVKVVCTPPPSGLDHRTVSLSRLNGLRKLKLNYFHFNCFFELVDLICAFEDLVDISLDSVFWGEDGTPKGRSPPRNVRTFHLGDTDKERIFEWILSSASSSLLSSIRTVNLRHINPSQMPTLRQFLRAVGPSLQELRLSFNFDWAHKSPDILAGDMPLASQLRSIEIEAYAYTSPRLEVWYTLLSRITSTHLESVVFNIWSWTSFNRDTWADMDKLFASPARFSRLRVVCVRLLFLGGNHHAGKWLCERLPGCAARGVLTLGLTVC